MRCSRSVLVPVLACVLASTVELSSCSGKKEDVAASAPTDTLTRRQRDSIIIKAKLPGAGAVGRAMGAVDRANANAEAHDSIERALR